MTEEIVVLSQEDVIKIIPSMKEIVETIEEVFRAHGENRAVLPSKTYLNLHEAYRGHFTALPAYIETSTISAAGIKWLSNFDNNIEKYNLPAIMATIALNDPITGRLKAIVDGTLLTGIRTGAATAAGAKYLARKDSDIVAIIGASFQGRYQLMALNEAFNINQVRVYDIIKGTCRKYVKEMTEKLKLDIREANSSKDAVKEADIIVTATRTPEPFFDKTWCEPGMLIVSIGSMPELRSNILQSLSKIVIDSIDGCKHLGSLSPFFSQGLLTEQNIYATIGEIVSNKKAGRETDTEIILYVPMGMGTEDVATAYKIYEIALDKDVGQRVHL